MTTNLSIGEFARATGLSVSAVRFYADRGLLTPIQVDSSSGYRWFSLSQIKAGLLIRDLRQIDMSLRDVEDALAMEQRDVAQLVDGHVHRLEDGVRRARHVAAELTPSLGEGPRQPMSAALEAGGEVRTSDLCAAIDQVLPFASTDLHLPHLMTVKVEAKDGSVRLLATDTYRFALRDVVAVRFSDEGAGLVAAASLSEIRSKLEPVGEATLSIDAVNLTLEHPGGRAEIRLIPATFPDYERFLVPRELVSTVVVSKQALGTALRELARHDSVQLATANGDLIVTQDDARVTISGQGGSGPNASTNINAALGLDCAEGAIGSEVEVEIPVDSNDPVVFRSATDGTYTSFLMPVKVT